MKKSEIVLGKVQQLRMQKFETSLDQSGSQRSLNSAQLSNGTSATYAFMYTQTYLTSIKIFCDWLLSDREIVSSNLQSFRMFRSELENMVSLLNEINGLLEDLGLTQAGNHIYKHAYNGAAWIQRYPLSCDFPLLNLSSVKDVHELNIDFDFERDLNDSESGFITIQCIIAFSQALAGFLTNKNYQ